MLQWIKISERKGNKNSLLAFGISHSSRNKHEFDDSVILLPSLSATIKMVFTDSNFASFRVASIDCFYLVLVTNKECIEFQYLCASTELKYFMLLGIFETRIFYRTNLTKKWMMILTRIHWSRVCRGCILFLSVKAGKLWRSPLKKRWPVVAALLFPEKASCGINWTGWAEHTDSLVTKICRHIIQHQFVCGQWKPRLAFAWR